jgi:hypothetical protein
MDERETGQPIRCCCHPAVVWAVESVGLVLIRRDTSKRAVLGYPEAALWDLLSRATPMKRLIPMMAAIAGLTPGSACSWVGTTMQTWAREGWIIAGKEDG